jgi:hypothetical protein
MLPNQSTDVQTAENDTSTTTALPSGLETVPAVTSSTVAALDDDTPDTGIVGASSDFDTLKVDSPELDTDVVATTEEELFASVDTTQIETTTETATTEFGTRTLSTSNAAATTPSLSVPDTSNSVVVEKPAEITLAPSKPVVEVETPEPKVSAAPKFSLPERRATTNTVSPVLPTIDVPTFSRTTAQSISNNVTQVTDRVYDGLMRAGSLPQTVIDKLFAAGAYISSADQKSFAYNVRTAAKTSLDNQVVTLSASNGVNVDLNFLSTQNQVVPTFVSRSNKMEHSRPI